MLSVREMQESDVPHIVAYWHSADHDFLREMGADPDKVPPRDALHNFLIGELAKPYPQRSSYATIWELDGRPVGHCNVNNIRFGKDAYMHLHLWYSTARKRGMGTELVKQSLAFFFQNLELEALFCEPYRHNPAPNRTLEKIGFEFQGSSVKVPGSINFEQEVNTWKLTHSQFECL